MRRQRRCRRETLLHLWLRLAAEGVRRRPAHVAEGVRRRLLAPWQEGQSAHAGNGRLQTRLSGRCGCSRLLLLHLHVGLLLLLLHGARTHGPEWRPHQHTLHVLGLLLLLVREQQLLLLLQVHGEHVGHSGVHGAGASHRHVCGHGRSAEGRHDGHGLRGVGLHVHWGTRRQGLRRCRDRRRRRRRNRRRRYGCRGGRSDW